MTTDTNGLSLLTLPRRLRAFAALATAALATAAVTSGYAFAQSRSNPIGTGVVVIETNLAYQGASAAGTGMVLSSSGEILTNNHVIRGATTIKVVVPKTVTAIRPRWSATTGPATLRCYRPRVRRS